MTLSDTVSQKRDSSHSEYLCTVQVAAEAIQTSSTEASWIPETVSHVTLCQYVMFTVTGMALDWFGPRPKLGDWHKSEGFGGEVPYNSTSELNIQSLRTEIFIQNLNVVP